MKHTHLWCGLTVHRRGDNHPPSELRRRQEKLFLPRGPVEFGSWGYANSSFETGVGSNEHATHTGNHSVDGRKKIIPIPFLCSVQIRLLL
jgi:hypothetical protein